MASLNCTFFRFFPTVMVLVPFSRGKLLVVQNKTAKQYVVCCKVVTISMQPKPKWSIIFIKAAESSNHRYIYINNLQVMPLQQCRDRGLPAHSFIFAKKFQKCQNFLYPLKCQNPETIHKEEEDLPKIMNCMLRYFITRPNKFGPKPANQ